MSCCCCCSCLRDTDTCGTPRCKDVELHISGTRFTVEHAYALTDPTTEDRYDPACTTVGDKRRVNPKHPPSKTDDKAVPAPGKTKPGQQDKQPANDATKARPAAESAKPSRLYIDPDTTPPTGLPEQVWTGFAYMYSGYVKVVSKKHGQVDEGFFNMAWPVEGCNYYYCPNWQQVPSSGLPSDALLIKKPYTATLQFLDGHKGSKGYNGHEEYEKVQEGPREHNEHPEHYRGRD